MIQKKPFTKYSLDDTERKQKPITIKLNDKETLMIEAGKYMLNLESKGGVMKYLAKVGLKVLLNQFTADDWHYITSPNRRRYQYERPNIEKLMQDIESFKKW